MSILKNRLKEVEIDLENPFLHDALGREKYAEILTSVVNTYSYSGCVLAIDGKWGTGKTTFVNMWKAYMDNHGYKTIYFNAWESDYMEDPLIALVSELQILNDDKEAISKVAANVGKIVIAAGLSAIKGVLKAKLGIDGEIIKDTIDQAKEVGMKSLDEYVEEKSTFEDFKSSLVEFVADNAREKPIVFFIDELDRCRPDYAVKVLERIKHLFDIPNIVFVLSINKRQLGYAIQGYYGTANMDAEDYLRRFIDLEYELPKPNMQEFSKYLYDEYGFDSFLSSPQRLQYFRRGEEPEEFRTTAAKLAETCRLDLRTQDRVFAICRLSLEALKDNNYLMPDVLYILCLLKVKYGEVYTGIKTKSYSVQELIDALESTVLKDYKQDSERNSFEKIMEYSFAALISNYNHPYYESIVDKTFVGQDSEKENQKEYPFKVTKLDKEKLNEAFDWVINHSNEKMHMGLKFSLDRIDLLSPLIQRNVE